MVGARHHPLRGVHRREPLPPRGRWPGQRRGPAVPAGDGRRGGPLRRRRGAPPAAAPGPLHQGPGRPVDGAAGPGLAERREPGGGPQPGRPAAARTDPAARAQAPSDRLPGRGLPRTGGARRGVAQALRGRGGLAGERWRPAAARLAPGRGQGHRPRSALPQGRRTRYLRREVGGGLPGGAGPRRRVHPRGGPVRAGPPGGRGRTGGAGRAAGRAHRGRRTGHGRAARARRPLPLRSPGLPGAGLRPAARAHRARHRAAPGRARGPYPRRPQRQHQQRQR